MYLKEKKAKKNTSRSKQRENNNRTVPSGDWLLKARGKDLLGLWPESWDPRSDLDRKRAGFESRTVVYLKPIGSVPYTVYISLYPNSKMTLTLCKNRV
jgi:hypothetical protein